MHIRTLIILILLLGWNQFFAQEPPGMLPEFFAQENVQKAGIKEVSIYAYNGEDSLPMRGKRSFVLAKDLAERITFNEKGQKLSHAYFRNESELPSDRNSYSYDATGNIQTILYESISKGQVNFQRETTYAYNEEGRKISQSIDLVSQSLRVADSKTTFSYNPNGTPREELTQFLSPEMQGRSQRIFYKWMGQDSVDKEDWLEEKLNGRERYVCRKGKLVHFYVPDNDYLSYRYVYDKAGRLIHEYFAPRSETPSSVPGTVAIRYYYNKDGFLEMVSRKHLDGSWTRKVFHYSYD